MPHGRHYFSSWIHILPHLHISDLEFFPYSSFTWGVGNFCLWRGRGNPRAPPPLYETLIWYTYLLPAPIVSLPLHYCKTLQHRMSQNQPYNAKRKKTPTSLPLHSLSAGLSFGSYWCRRYGKRNEGYYSKLHQERLFTRELPLPLIPARGLSRKLEPDAAYRFRLQRLALSGKLRLPGFRQLPASLALRMLINEHQTLLTLGGTVNTGS